jgi:ribonucleoside-diphosphate reductase alpha chain
MCQWDGEPILPVVVIRDKSDRVIDTQEIQMPASDLFDEIVAAAWEGGEPGCVFIDTVNRANPLPGLGPIQCCNPCGEQFLHDGDACNLGAINLAKFVLKAGKRDAVVDFERLRSVTAICVRFLDDVIDLTHFPVDRVENTFKANRRIGLGVMGLADMLFDLRKGYNTEEGRQVAVQVMHEIREAAIQASIAIGKEKGNFRNFAMSIWAERTETMRNSSLTNVAPTGSTAMVASCCSGIEPYFALFYRRPECSAGVMKPFLVPQLHDALAEAGCAIPPVFEEIYQRGTLQHIEGLPQWIKDVFVTSQDITAADHIRMQGAVQKECCNAISKTINFPSSASMDEVRNGFISAWEAGCKGVTVYRDGSKTGQVLQTSDSQPIFKTTCRSGSCDL